jgi:hypothetical protein
MSDDVARLGLQIDTSQVSTAKSELAGLATSAKNAEAAATSLKNSASGVAATMPGAAKAAATVAAAQASIAATAAPATAAVTALGTATEGETVSAAAMAAALKATGGSLKSITPAMVGLADASAAGAAAMEAQTVAATETAPALAAVAANAEVAAAAEDEAALASAAVTRELIVLGREGLVGNFSRLPGSLLVMSNRLQTVGAGALNAKTLFTLLGSVGATLFNPFIIGIVGVTVALNVLPKIFGAITNSIASAENVLKEHETAIKDIKAAWDDATKSEEQYGSRAQTSIAFTGNSDQIRLQNLLKSQLQNIPFELGFGNGSRAAAGAYQSTFGPLADAVEKFRQQALQGKGDVLAFNEEIQKIALQNPADQKLQSIANHILDVTKGATDTTGALRDLNAELQQVSVSMGGLDPAAVKALAQGYSALATLAIASRRQAATMAGITATTPAQRAAAASASVLAEPQDYSTDPTGSIRQYNAEAAAANVLASAQQELVNSANNRYRAVMDAVGASQIDIDVIGKSVGETELLKDNWQTYADLRAEADKNGTKFDDAQYARLVKQNEALAALKQTEAEMSELNNLQFAGTQIGRTDTEQTVASTLRDLFGDDYLSHMNDAIAGQIRFNDALSATGDTAKSALSTFVSDLRQGKSGIDAVVDALGNVEDKLLDIAENNLISGLLGNGSSGGGLLGSIVSAITGLGSTSSSPPAVNGLLGHNAGGTNNWRGGPTWVGEQGPEVVDLPAGARVTPNYKLRSGGGAGSTPPVEVHIHEAPAGTTVSESTGANGGLRIDVMLNRQIENTVADLISGGTQNKVGRALKQNYGAQRRM